MRQRLIDAVPVPMEIPLPPASPPLRMVVSFTNTLALMLESMLLPVNALMMHDSMCSTAPEVNETPVVAVPTPLKVRPRRMTVSVAPAAIDAPVPEVVVRPAETPDGAWLVIAFGTLNGPSQHDSSTTTSQPVFVKGIAQKKLRLVGVGVQ